ncbi:MAG: PrgI family protein [Patescibacteria group bacterium]
MATYKVLQDIEAEDKLIGPLTFKQLVFGFIAAGIMFLGWFVARSSSIFIFIPFFILASPFLFLAAPIGQDQPNDVWLGARLRFFFKPRVRKWDQTGQSEYVTVTAPKREEHVYTDGLEQTEVESRLKLLANTLDSRGWAVKNSNVNLEKVTSASTMSDGARLVHPGDLPQEVQQVDIHASDDMFDGTARIGQNVDQLMSERQEQARISAVRQMQTTPTSGQVLEAEFLDQLHKQQDRLGIHHGDEVAEARDVGHSAVAAERKIPEIPKAPDTNQQLGAVNDLKVSTLASLAKNKKSGDDTLTDDTVIELH